MQYTVERLVPLLQRLASLTWQGETRSLARLVLNEVTDATASPQGLFGYLTMKHRLHAYVQQADGGEAEPLSHTISVDDLQLQPRWSEVLGQGRSLLVNDALQVRDGHPALRRVLAVAVQDQDQDKVLGLLAVANRDHDYTAADQALLERYARLLAPVVQARVEFELQRGRQQREHAALHQEGVFLQSIVDGLPDAMMVIDLDYRVVLANRASQELTGHSRPASSALRCYQVHHQRDSPCNGFDEPCPLQVVRRTGAPVTVLHSHICDDRERLFEVSVAPIFGPSGEVDSVVERLRDVTDLATAERGREEAEQSRHQIIASVGEGLVVFDRGLRCWEWNPCLERLTGTAAADAHGKHFHQLLPALYGPGDDRDLQRALSGETFVTDDRRLRVTADGKEIWVVAVFGPYLDVTGTVVGVVGAVRDVSARRAAAARERRQLEALHQAQRLASAGIVASGAAHEINNPVSALLLNAQLLGAALRDARPILDRQLETSGDFAVGGMRYSELREELDAVIASISTSVQRIHKVTAAVRELGVLAPGTTQERTQLNGVVRQALALFEDRWRSRYQPLVELDPALPEIVAQAAQLELVVGNLLDNAAQALRAPAQKLEVSTHWDPVERRVHLLVRDEGEGIAEADLAQIMTPFFSRRRDQGERCSGLGLSTAYTIVRRYRGALEVSSEPGRGTLVRVTFPPAQAPEDRPGDLEG